MASKEANKAKYQYNKKYVEAYWERKAKRMAEQTEASNERDRLERRVTTTTVEEYFKTEKEEVNFCIPTSRPSDMTDERWIKYLEDCCKCLNSENKRLIKLLGKYQEVISIGLKDLSYQLSKNK